jgi:ABC-type multidrug transport system fused ATPase/permease subunit
MDCGGGPKPKKQPSDSLMFMFVMLVTMTLVVRVFMGMVIILFAIVMVAVLLYPCSVPRSEAKKREQLHGTKRNKGESDGIANKQTKKDVLTGNRRIKSTLSKGNPFRDNLLSMGVISFAFRVIVMVVMIVVAVMIVVVVMCVGLGGVDDNSCVVGMMVVTLMSVIGRALLMTMIMGVGIRILFSAKLFFEVLDLRSKGSDVGPKIDLLAGRQFGKALLDLVGDGLHHGVVCYPFLLS